MIGTNKFIITRTLRLIKLRKLTFEYDLLTEKVHRLSEEKIIESDAANKFKLDKQLEISDAERSVIENEITTIEISLSYADIRYLEQSQNISQRDFQHDNLKNLRSAIGMLIKKNMRLMLVSFLVMIPLTYFGVTLVNIQRHKISKPIDCQKSINDISSRFESGRGHQNRSPQYLHKDITTVLDCFDVDDSDTTKTKNLLAKLIPSLIAKFEFPHRLNVNKIEISDNGRYMALLIGNENKVEIWDLISKQISSNIGCYSKIRDIKFDPDKDCFAYAYLNFIEIVNLDSSVAIQKLENKNDIEVFEYSPNGGKLAILSTNNTVDFWDITNSDPIPISSSRQKTTLNQIAVNKNGFLAFAHQNDVIILSMVNEPQIVKTLTHIGYVTSIRYMKMSGHLITTSRDKQLRIWGEDFKPLNSYNYPNTNDQYLFNPDFGYYAIINYEFPQYVNIFDYNTPGKHLSFIGKTEKNIVQMSSSTDGRILATLDYSGSVNLWDMASIKKDFSNLSGSHLINEAKMRLRN